MKKFLALVLILAMVLCAMPTVFADDQPLEISAMVTQFQQAPDENGDFWKWMESTFNVDYSCEWVPETSYSDKMALVLSTADFPDILQVSSTTAASVVNAANDGLFYDLTDLIDPEAYPNLAALNKSAWMNSKINGRNYFLPRTRGQYNNGLYLRQDILDEMGVSTPVTLSEYEAYFRYVKDNYPDMVPLACQLVYLDMFFLAAFGDGAIKPVYTEDGEGIVYEELTESYAQFIGWIQKLYADGILASEFALYNAAKNQDLFLAGLTSARMQNIWHRWRLETSLQQAVPEASLVPAFYVTSDDGKNVAVQYDTGFYGGLAINADCAPEKVEKMLAFFNQTADPANYYTFRYGLEGVHWNMVDGYPVSTDKGKEEVTVSFYGPFCLATNLYDKVDSAAAPAAYNNESREMAKTIDTAAELVGAAPFRIFTLINSSTWSTYWAVEKTNFDSFVADTIMGNHTIDELRAYQAQILATDEVQTACKEFKESYDLFGLADWTPSN